MKKILTYLVISLICFNCSEDKDDNLTLGPSMVNVSFAFTHDWDGTLINSANLQSEIVTNEHGEVISMTRLRYLISRFELIHENGDSYLFEGYKFTDLSDESTYSFVPINTIPLGNYTLKFIWGFNELDNVDGAYADLNSASWNWPALLGGGYHFLQFDGTYNVDTTAPAPFNYHNGTARVSDGVFEQNFATISLSTPISIRDNAIIEVKMNIAEFFKNPNTWDLNVLDTPLMPNYNAQKMMQENVMTVFSIGNITQ